MSGVEGFGLSDTEGWGSVLEDVTRFRTFVEDAVDVYAHHTAPGRTLEMAHLVALRISRLGQMLRSEVSPGSLAVAAADEI